MVSGKKLSSHSFVFRSLPTPLNVGRFDVIIHSDDLESINALDGDYVRLSSKDSLSSIAILRVADDVSERGVLKANDEVRRNSGATKDGAVIAQKAFPQAALSLVLRPSNLQSAKLVTTGTSFLHGLFKFIPFFHGARASLVGGLRSSLYDAPLVQGNNVGLDWESEALEYQVFDSEPSGPIIITENTDVKITHNADFDQSGKAVSYDDVGGLGKEIARVREMVELPIRHPELFDQLGIDPPKGILFFGPPGCGKTLIARAVAYEAGCHFISINGPEVIQQHYGESEAQLRQIFESAQEHPASIIFIDEIDAVAPNRETVLGDVEKRVVAQLLSLMDGLNTRGQVIVIAATNLPNNIDPALRRPGRFDREINIGPPDKVGREEILRIHTRTMPLNDDVDLKRVAEKTHGFLGADLAALCREAAMLCARDAVSTLQLNNRGQYDKNLSDIKVGMQHFELAQNEIDLSTTRQVFTEIPSTSWDDVGGLEDIRNTLRDVVEYPLMYADRFEQLSTQPPKGVLLTGGPGTGKTLLAKALAAESGINFISVKGPELLSKWVGDSEKGIRDIFKKARQAAPSIVFFDEIDTITPVRGGGDGGGGQISERMVGQFLLEMDSIDELRGVTVLAATNRPDLIDPALLRPGRFDLVLELPTPNELARRSILEVHCRHRLLADDVLIDQLAIETKGMNGADIESFCRQAAMLAIRESINDEPGPIYKSITLSARHFAEALSINKIT